MWTLRRGGRYKGLCRSLAPRAWREKKKKLGLGGGIVFVVGFGWIRKCFPYLVSFVMKNIVITVVRSHFGSSHHSLFPDKQSCPEIREEINTMKRVNPKQTEPNESNGSEDTNKPQNENLLNIKFIVNNNKLIVEVFPQETQKNRATSEQHKSNLSTPPISENNNWAYTWSPSRTDNINWITQWNNPWTNSYAQQLEQQPAPQDPQVEPESYCFLEKVIFANPENFGSFAEDREDPNCSHVYLYRHKLALTPSETTYVQKCTEGNHPRPYKIHDFVDTRKSKMFRRPLPSCRHKPLNAFFIEHSLSEHCAYYHRNDLKRYIFHYKKNYEWQTFLPRTPAHTNAGHHDPESLLQTPRSVKMQ